MEMKEEEAFLFAQRIGALDFDENESYFAIYFPYEKIGEIKKFGKDINLGTLEIIYRPQTLIHPQSESVKHQVTSLIEALETLEDVHHVFSNMSSGS
jgi:transcriptional/translational regulatory protein YebC/TACO1